MPRFLILAIAILHLSIPLFFPANAVAFKVGKALAQGGAPPKVSSKLPSKAVPAVTSPVSSPSVGREVVNILVDRIEGGTIYSKDGQQFEITSSTKVINNSHNVINLRSAELTFANGILVGVSIK